MATWVIVYFVPIVFIGAFFLLNLTIAVIKSKFSEEHKNKKKFRPKKKDDNKRKRADDSAEEEARELFGGDLKKYQ